jgi:hypothetical protein
MITSRRLKWSGYVSRIGDEKYKQKSEGKRPLGRPDAGGRIISKLML